MSIHNECKLSLIQGMNKYNDIYFQALIKIFKSIRVLKELSTDSIRSLIFKTKQRKVSVGTPLLQFKEYSPSVFFLFSGIVSVYIVDQSEGEMHLFQDLKEGSSFNLLNCMLNHYSLFYFEAKTDLVLMELNKSDFLSTAKSDHNLNKILKYLSTN